jgi:hypothetical protein
LLILLLMLLLLSSLRSVLLLLHLPQLLLSSLVHLKSDRPCRISLENKTWKDLPDPVNL